MSGIPIFNILKLHWFIQTAVYTVEYLLEGGGGYTLKSIAFTLSVAI